MKQLVFSSRNKGKINEVSQLIKPLGYKLLGLDDINCHEEIEETGNTFLENSQLKADYIYYNYQFDCFADDSGLEIASLNNEPGVFSARYAGIQSNDQNNMDLVLHKLKGVKNRQAQFVTVITLILNGQYHFFEGKVFGLISLRPKGSFGFGYDPIFIPSGQELTFAEMPTELKNKISHRSKAIQKMIQFLQSLKN